MQLVAQVKLQTTQEQHASLKQTLLNANNAANFLSEYAWDNKIFHKFNLQKVLYSTVKDTFGLSAQVTVRVISKVSDAYKPGKKTKREFRDTGSIAYDSRILSWKMKEHTVSIWTIGGRLRIPFLTGEHQLKLLEYRRGEADLMFCDGAFYLNQTCDIPEPAPSDPKGFVGIDLGIVNLATTSEGDTFCGAMVDRVRERTTKIRSALQKRGTKSAKRHLRKIAKRESRFKKDTNHVISKKIVSQAKDTGQAIVIEDLRGFNGRQTVCKAQRERFGKWAFDQLGNFIIYKAKLAGVPVIKVDPRNTSRTCCICGCVSKKNRKSQSLFSCIKCGNTMNADLNAAINIALKGSTSTCPSQSALMLYYLLLLELQAPHLNEE